MERLTILRQIDRLEEAHCLGCPKVEGLSLEKRQTYCNDRCAVGKQIQGFGEQLLELKRDRVATLLNKGPALTTAEIHWLLGQEISKAKIVKVMRVSRKTLNKRLEAYKGTENECY